MHRVYRFADFELNLLRHELSIKGSAVKLERIPMELLTMLVERPGELITREEIVARLWGDAIHVDTEQGIHTAVRKVRQALRDDPENPTFIQTVVGKGYRFDSPVTALSRPAAGANAQTGVQLRPKPIRFWVAGIALVAMMLTLAALNGLLSAPPGRTSPAAPIQSLAVLPLENMTGDATQDYLSDGMTEELITQLAQLPSVRIISRGSVMQFKGKARPMSEIRERLQVDAVLEGSLRRTGDRLRVTAQLIRTDTDQHLWARNFDRDLHDVLAMQTEIASEVARQLQLEFATKAAPPAATSGSAEAYDEYLRGRFAWNRRTRLGLQEAIEHFRRATELDPNSAAAYSGLADSYATFGYLSYLAPREAFPSAMRGAMRAMQLDSSLAEPYASLAYARFYYDWNWAEAEKGFQKAIALNPNYATAHQWYAVYLTAMGRRDQALAEVRRAQQLDPLSTGVATDVGFHLYYGGRYDDAITQLRAVLQANPGFPLAHFWLSRAYLAKKMFPEALAEADATGPMIKDWPVALLSQGFVYAAAGRKAEARRILAESLARARKEFVTEYGIALIYLGLGEEKEALAWLDKAFASRSHWLVWLNLDPRWNDLRDHPRFQAVLRRMNFPTQ